MSENQTMDLFKSKVEEQEEYVEELESRGESSFSLVAARAFVEGMRDSGYKSTATALDEMIDNSEEAEASRVDVIYTKEGQNVSNIAVVDDGHGMTPKMIRAAVLWGGTHRWNSREGLGRYGFGLPSAAVSITKHYEVYSKVTGGDWHRVVIDLDEVAEGALTNADGVVVAPEPEVAELPGFVQDHLEDQLPVEHGTVVFLRNPDRLSAGFKAYYAFHRNLMRNLGTVYRDMLRDLDLSVGEPGSVQNVEPVDPLFLMPSAWGYDVGNEIFAEELEPIQFEVENPETGRTGNVQIRISYMPPGFQEENPVDPTDSSRVDERFRVMKDNNSFFIVNRAGRQIDRVDNLRFPSDRDNFTLVNFDRNWAIEVNFDPVLDEQFGITVNKQQVTLTDRMWQILKNHNLPATIRTLRKRFKEDRQERRGKEEEARSKASEKVMADADKFRTKPRKRTQEQKEKAKKRVKKDAQERASQTGQDPKDVERKLLEETFEKPYEVIFESLKGAPFYRAEQYGGQVRLYINTSHRFYSDVYSLLSDEDVRDRRLKVALELLLFVLGACEVEVTSEEREKFYISERQEWSTRYRKVLGLLDDIDSITDIESAAAEREETSSD